MAEQNGAHKTPANKGQSGAPSGSSSSGAAASARLPTFRAPRDLTLSASTTALVKPSLMTRTRKTFSPNIPSKREKVDNSFETHSDKPTKRRDRDKNAKKEGGRGRGKNKEFIQTAGSLFGEGIAGATPRRGGPGSFGGRGGGGGGSAKAEAGFIHKPVLNLETVNNIDKEHEDQKLKELLRDDFIDDPDDVLGHSEEDLFPVQLPLVTCGRSFKEEEDIKPPIPAGDLGVEVKKEPEESSEDPEAGSAAPEAKNLKPPDKKVLLKTGLPAQGKAPELSVTQLLSGKHEEVLFFQLPNSLPSHPPEVKQEPSAIHSVQQQQKASNSAEGEEEKKAAPQYCTLNTLPEGHIGNLKVYKSGKVELWLGNHKLAVSKGTQVGFLQDVVSIDVDSETKTGTMTALGHVGHRLVCTPDLEALVRQMKT